MKTNYLKRSLRSVACLLLAFILLIGTTTPAFANFVDKNGEPIDDDTAYEILHNMGLDDAAIKKMSEMDNVVIETGSETTTTGEDGHIARFQNFKNSDDATVIKKDHLAREWGELDWSMASDGYVWVKINKLVGPNTRVFCWIDWYDTRTDQACTKCYTLQEGEWTIPLPDGRPEYFVSLCEGLSCCEHNMTKEEKTYFADPDLKDLLDVAFKTTIKDPDAKWKISTPAVNYAHAPMACEKALELTKNCKTDAEKITAIFNWVSKNIKYDNKEWDRIQKSAKNKTPATSVSCLIDEKNGTHLKTPDPKEDGYKNQDQLDLDLIMTKKTGVCAHMAVLTAGMLRSVGIPCKVIDGTITAKGKSVNHAWIAVKPETGKLDLVKLGAGKDYEPKLPDEDDNQHPTGWIRLDPTNANTPKETAKDANYSVTKAY